MSIRWSRIHAALGVQPQDLTYDLVRTAVAQGLSESEDLDWKQALPPNDEKKKKEFAKDVAALANSRGGLIVFGVTESNEQASGRVAVPNLESDRQRLRLLAQQHIRPLVAGLEFVALDDANEPGLLVVSVPVSPDAPHIVGEQNQMGVPHRDGSTTRWMSEHQLARAYDERRDRRVHAEKALDGLIMDVQMHVGPGLWFVLASQPATPVSTLTGAASAGDAAKTVGTATDLAVTILPGPEQRGDPREDVLSELNLNPIAGPRIGLRRWIFTRRRRQQEPTDRLHVELHHGGAAVLACTVLDDDHMRDLTEPGYIALRVARLESAVVDSLALAAASARDRGCVGMISIKAAIAFSDDERRGRMPIRITRWTRFEGLHLVDDARPLLAVKEVVLDLRSDATADDLRNVARQVAEDVLHQFGVEQLTLLRSQQPR